jgi:hypothetical protein
MVKIQKMNIDEMGNPQPSSKGTYGSPLTPPFIIFTLRVNIYWELSLGEIDFYECSSETKW